MNKKHLPILGIGPIYVISIFILSIIGLTLNYTNVLAQFRMEIFKIPFIIIASLLICIGIIMWVLAVFQSQLDQKIKNNQLITNGIFALTRNPIYSAFLFVNTGIILITYNLLLLVLPILYYIYLTILLIFTEEKWLQKEFDNDYLQYKNTVNRIIPIPKFKKTNN